MIDGINLIGDLLIKFCTHKESHRAKFDEQIIDPLFATVKSIVGQYRTMALVAIDTLERGDGAQVATLIADLKTVRQKYLMDRMQVDGWVTTIWKKGQEPAGAFVMSVWETFYSNCYVGVELREQSGGALTISLLERENALNPDYRAATIEALRVNLRGIDTGWQRLAAHYAKYKVQRV